MKNILEIQYSQSDQLTELTKNIAKPLTNYKDLNVVYHQIKMETGHAYPWFFFIFIYPLNR
jgi:hypothetical protein